MAESTKELSKKLAIAGASMVPSAFENHIKCWYAANRKRAIAWTGSEKRAALFIAGAYAQVNKIPELLSCTPESFQQCLVYSMGMNLLPGPMGECYFIPYKKTATFIPGYQGLVKLAFNGGFVTKIHGHVVWENDEFDYNPAFDLIHHKIFKGAHKDRGKRIGVYAAIKNIHGETQFTYMNAEDIAGIKARSRGAASSFSPWNSEHSGDVDAMWLKSALKRGIKLTVKDSERNFTGQLARAIEIDNQSDGGAEPGVSMLPEDIETIAATITQQVAEPKAITDKGE